MDSPLVSIVTINWNGLEDTEECIHSLLGVTYQNVEIIVVDNGSSGRDAELLEKEFGKTIHLVKSDTNLGFAKGNNLGATAAMGKYVLFLNNDATVDKDFLPPLVKAFESDRQIGVGMPVIRDYHADWIQSAGNRLMLHGKIRQTRVLPRADITEVGYASGAAMFLRRADFEKVDGFDQDLFMYGEDAELCFRIARLLKKKSVCITRSVVYHKAYASTKKKGRGFLVYNDYYGKTFAIVLNLRLAYIRLAIVVLTMVVEMLYKPKRIAMNVKGLEGMMAALKFIHTNPKVRRREKPANLL